MKNFFDLLIGDEIHEYKSRGSAQGIAAGILSDACGRSLSLTGNPHGRLLIDNLPSAVPVLTRDQDGVRSLRGAPVDKAVRL